jgi:hypothetical protein
LYAEIILNLTKKKTFSALRKYFGLALVSIETTQKQGISPRKTAPFQAHSTVWAAMTRDHGDYGYLSMALAGSPCLGASVVGFWFFLIPRDDGDSGDDGDSISRAAQFSPRFNLSS